MPAGPARGKTASTRSRCPESWRARAPAPHGCTQLCRGHDGGRSMYAVIRAGGKQYRVAPGDVVRLATQAGGKDGKVEFGDVLAVSASAGEIVRPWSGALVTGQVLGDDRAKKIIVFHYKKKKQYKKLAGHRQPFSSVRITEIAF